jgi:hypothetical protein
LCSALLLSGCGFIPSQEKEPIVASGNSQFTKNGIEAMKATRKVSFDFTSLPMDMAALGLGEDSDGAMVATDTDRRMKVAMTTPNGVVEMETDTIRVRGGGVENKVDSVDIFVNYPDAQDANPEIERAANELGILPLKNATTIGPAFKDGSGKETWNPGYGNATGTVFALSIMSNHTTGRMTFIYTVFLSEEYYTPEAQAQIAETGRF